MAASLKTDGAPMPGNEDTAPDFSQPVRFERIILPAEEFDRVIAECENPPPPTQALLDLAALYRKRGMR